jgi:hypothetical protein
MAIVIPYKNFQLENLKFYYKVFHSYALPPCRDKGIAGDLFILEQYGVLFYKANSTTHSQGEWLIAYDEHIILHPFEPSHRLTMTFDEDDEFIVTWAKHAQKLGPFRNAFPSMKEKIYNDTANQKFQVQIATRGDNFENPIDVDDELSLTMFALNIFSSS